MTRQEPTCNASSRHQCGRCQWQRNGTLLAFDPDGGPLGAFSNDGRIADPRGLAVDLKERLLFLNSGSDRILALDPDGRVVVTPARSKD